MAETYHRDANTPQIDHGLTATSVKILTGLWSLFLNFCKAVKGQY